MKRVTIVMYHFIRNLQHTRYPRIKALLTSQFREQLLYLSKYYEFVKIEDCINAIYSEDRNFPQNSVLLTFDDGYIDHFTTVFPIMKEMNIQGCFFPPVKPIMESIVLDVNKIHFILAAVSNINVLLNDLYNLLNKYRSEFNLKSNEYYYYKLALERRYDSKEVIFIKNLLQEELDKNLRELILDELFSRYVTNDEAAFSKELYMSLEQLKYMIRNGMYVGCHGYNHDRLSSLSPKSQEKEIDNSLIFLEEIESSTENWAMCYPYGYYNNSLINILKGKKCKIGLSTNIGIAELSNDNAFTLQRLDTNDLPKKSDSEINSWTHKI